VDIDGFDSTVRASGFTGVVVVRQAGAVVFNEAYGFATPRWQVPNTVDTRFDTASITKLFTSVAVLQQVGLNRLDLDASIHRYVDLSGTTISSAVSLRHLLTHTSGIADDAATRSWKRLTSCPSSHTSRRWPSPGFKPGTAT
jgi:CubicO group peptidase (beta-lactamase class C family)